MDTVKHTRIIHRIVVIINIVVSTTAFDIAMSRFAVRNSHLTFATGRLNQALQQAGGNSFYLKNIMSARKLLI
jgi:hypothetical protein